MLELVRRRFFSAGTTAHFTGGKPLCKQGALETFRIATAYVERGDTPKLLFKALANGLKLADLDGWRASPQFGRWQYLHPLPTPRRVPGSSMPASNLRTPIKGIWTTGIRFVNRGRREDIRQMNKSLTKMVALRAWRAHHASNRSPDPLSVPSLLTVSCKSRNSGSMQVCLTMNLYFYNILTHR